MAHWGRHETGVILGRLRHRIERDLRILWCFVPRDQLDKPPDAGNTVRRGGCYEFLMPCLLYHNGAEVDRGQETRHHWCRGAGTSDTCQAMQEESACRTSRPPRKCP